MRSRAARLTLGAVAWIAIGASAVFLHHSEQQIAVRRTALRAFDVRAREAVDALEEIRAGQQAYVAAGQGVAFWTRKVAATLEAVTRIVEELRQAESSSNARAALGEASGTMADLANVDTRARDYLASNQPLMAGDVVFTEGGETATSAARQVESARVAEHQAADAAEGALRRQEATALGAAAGLVALIVLLLVPRPNAAAAPASLSIAPSGAPAAEPGELMLRNLAPAPAGPPARADVSASGAAGRAVSPVLRAAADLCADFSRVVDIAGLTMLLGRAAEVMDASGLIVWLGAPSGGELRAVLAHGYGEQALARMPTVPRSGDNAAAEAYRTGRLQIVVSRPGSSAGAVVAPIVGTEGCVGALSAEIRNGGESSDAVQALATIFSAQLAGILATSSAQTASSETPASERKAAHL